MRLQDLAEKMIIYFSMWKHSMSNFTINPAGVEELRGILKDGLAVAAEQLTDDIRAITPRDPTRPPKDPTRPVTGNLQKSIAYQVTDELEAKIGVNLEHNLSEGKTPILEYARYQEFGTPNMPARSYLRKGLIEKGKEALNTFVFYLRKKLK